MVNKGGQYDVLALDFSKAFDKVLHACIYNYTRNYLTMGSTWVDIVMA